MLQGDTLYYVYTYVANLIKILKISSKVYSFKLPLAYKEALEFAQTFRKKYGSTQVDICR